MTQESLTYTAIMEHVMDGMPGGVLVYRDVEKVEKDIERQISSGTNVFDYVNYRILTKEGTEKTVEEFGHLIHVPGGRTPPPA